MYSFTIFMADFVVSICHLRFFLFKGVLIYLFNNDLLIMDLASIIIGRRGIIFFFIFSSTISLETNIKLYFPFLILSFKLSVITNISISLSIVCSFLA